MYNADLINNSIAARKRIRAACRAVARHYSPIGLPELVIARIHSRRKLAAFLEAIELSPEAIRSIFWAHDMAVPRDRTLKASAEPKPEPRPDWLRNLNQTDEYIF